MDEGSSDKLRAARALCTALGGWFGRSALSAPASGWNWPQVLDLARHSKTIGLLLPGLTKAGVAVPREIAGHLASAQEELVERNFANFLQTIRVQELLAQRSVPALVFKGPLRALEVYGSWGLRRSNDVDVLVPPWSYRLSAAILQDAGYQALVSPRSRWWHDYLKESPYRPPDGGNYLVDLHHGVQQPGGPSPVEMARFFEESRDFEVGGKALRVPSPGHALLITVISFGKAVFASEPWAGYAHEIAYVLANTAEDQRQAYRQLAKQSGMVRLFDEAAASAYALLELGHCPVSEEARIYEDQAELLESAMGMAERGKFHRLKHMWRWSDGSGPAMGMSFASHTYRLAMSELVRRHEGL